jgi:hypothetical protein
MQGIAQGVMRVRITRQPVGHVHGISLNYYRPGEVYDLPQSLAEYLVMEDYAKIEMRVHERQIHVVEERRRRA